MSIDDIQRAAAELKFRLSEMDELAYSDTDPRLARKRRALQQDLEDITQELGECLAWLDPVKMPSSSFDPADPGLFGIFAAIALLGQDREALSAMGNSSFYGSGVYAIYYNGEFPTYHPISRTETPIYVGVAMPANGVAKTPREQGQKLSGRLREHLRNIEKAQNLSIEDFECRRLVVATNWETKAEGALIHLFHPVWNKETKLIHGFGKHGDAMGTRANKRSPWDTLHEGRAWARGNESANVENQKSVEQICADLHTHFAKHPPIQDLQQVLHDLLSQIRKV